MKKTTASLILSVALASSAFAGTPDVYSSKGSKTVQPIAPMTPIGCECFAPGAALGIFGGVMLPRDGGSDVGGGGVLGEYFFTRHIGIQLSYGIYATDKEHHQMDGSLVFRLPIDSLCIAPYVLAGGGFSTNSEDRSDYHVGAGIEARFSKLNCMGVFADAAYHFAANSNDSDFTVVRIGVKFPF